MSLSTIEQQSYRWPPLESPEDIRLLHIQRSQVPDALIESSLQVASLRSPPQYNTLSYAWGVTADDGSHFTHMIRCDGRTLPVTASLHGALVAIRAHLSSASLPEDEANRPLWADAICIDQANLVERKAQVALMGRIYSTSSHLLIWLGEFVTPEEADDWYHEPWYREPRTFQRSPVEELILSSLQESTEVLHRIPKYPNDGRAYVLAERLQYRAWFHRRWVVQEVTQSCSADFLIGPYKFPFDAIRSLICRWPRRTGNATLLKPLRKLDSSEACAPRSSLLNHLVAYAERECSDPRDRIYAFLGIGTECHGITARYDVSADDLFVGFATQCIHDGEAAQVLTAAICRPAIRKSTLPSWVPNWRYSTRSNSRSDFESSLRQQGEDVWGGANIPEMLEVHERRLRATGWPLPPCSDHYLPRGAGYGLCAFDQSLRLASRTFERDRATGNTSYWQLFTFPLSLDEVSRAGRIGKKAEKKLVFLLRPKSCPPIAEARASDKLSRRYHETYDHAHEQDNGKAGSTRYKKQILFINEFMRRQNAACSSESPAREKSGIGSKIAVNTNQQERPFSVSLYTATNAVDEFELVGCLNRRLDLQSFCQQSPSLVSQYTGGILDSNDDRSAQDQLKILAKAYERTIWIV